MHTKNCTSSTSLLKIAAGCASLPSDSLLCVQSLGRSMYSNMNGVVEKWKWTGRKLLKIKQSLYPTCTNRKKAYFKQKMITDIIIFKAFVFKHTHAHAHTTVHCTLHLCTVANALFDHSILRFYTFYTFFLHLPLFKMSLLLTGNCEGQ